MTTTRERTKKKTTKDRKALAEDILAALEAAGVKDLAVARQVAETVANGNGRGRRGAQSRAVEQTKTSTASHEDAPLGVEPALPYNAQVVLEKRYFLKDTLGNPIDHSWADVCHRVARAIAEVEILYDPQADVARREEEFYRVMARMEFVPNSPTLMNAGTGAGTLSACFVLGLEDSMEGIMETAKEAALVQKFGGGTGFSLSTLRPKGAPISTTHGKACGPIAVLRHFSSVSTLVTQGGGSVTEPTWR